MDKKIGIIFGITLATWFISAIYLSIVFLIGTFVEVNPTISKFIFAYSFLTLVSLGLYNKYRGISLTKIGSDLKNMNLTVGKKEGCKTCKQRK